MAFVSGILKAVFITGPAKPTDAYRNQGFSRATELFAEVKPAHPPGFVAKTIRLFILCLNYLRPQVLLDTVRDWWCYAFGNGRGEAEIATGREIYYLARLIFFLLGLFVWRDCTLVVWIVAILLGDILLELAGDALVWGRYAINSQSTLLLSLMNYAEVTLAFAVFYAHCNCLERAPSPTEAFYLSAVIATTLGYVPKWAPEPNSAGMGLVIGQLAIFVLFALVFVSTFLSRSVGTPGTLTIQQGQTPEQVKAVLGNPGNIVEFGAKTTYVYKDLKVVFQDARVVEVY
jgi:hypothetical protein